MAGASIHHTSRRVEPALSLRSYAGLVARINSNLGENVGFLNPLIYELGPSVCRDVTGAAGPTNNSYSNRYATPPVPLVKGYPANPGWDACTGWGSIEGGNLYSALQSLFPRTVTLVLQRSTFGKDEVNSLLGGAAARRTRTRMPCTSRPTASSRRSLD